MSVDCCVDFLICAVLNRKQRKMKKLIVLITQGEKGPRELALPLSPCSRSHSPGTRSLQPGGPGRPACVWAPAAWHPGSAVMQGDAQVWHEGSGWAHAGVR